MDDEWDLAFDGGSPRTRKRILFRVNERLKREPGVEYTRFEPSRTAPTEVLASVEPVQFLGRAYPAPAATLAVWWSPRSAGNDHFAIQWYERAEEGSDPERSEDGGSPLEHTPSCGWHQDDHFNDLGEAHFQEEYPDGSVERYGRTFGDVSPLWILSKCLAELPERLDAYRDRLGRR